VIDRRRPEARGYNIIIIITIILFHIIIQMDSDSVYGLVIGILREYKTFTYVQRIYKYFF
jgi:hypothetical protein